MRISVWVHQVQTSYLQSGLGTDDSAVEAIAEIWGKVFDGLSFQSTWDRHANAIDGLAKVVERERMHEEDGGRGWKPWGVVRGRQPGTGNQYAQDEGELAAAVAKAGAGEGERRVCIIDLEPHYHGGSTPQFWRDDLGADGSTVRAFLNAFSSHGGQEIWVCLDARPAHMDSISFDAWKASPFVTRWLPMTYWTDFRQNWKTAVELTTKTLMERGITKDRIAHVFPGNARPDDMEAAIEHVAERGMLKPSVWQRLNLSESTAERIAGMDDPWEGKAPAPAPDLGLVVGGMQEVQRWIAAERERRAEDFKKGDQQLAAMSQRLQREVERAQEG